MQTIDCVCVCVYVQQSACKRRTFSITAIRVVRSCQVRYPANEQNMLLSLLINCTTVRAKLSSARQHELL